MTSFPVICSFPVVKIASSEIDLKLTISGNNDLYSVSDIEKSE